ncbi:MAG: family 10 glycosylhydrolase [Verrucomicrobiota bacterium]
MHKIIFIGFAALFVSLVCLGHTAEAPPLKEARGVWMHLHSYSADAEQGKKEVREAVKGLAEANFNLIMPWVVSEYAAALTDTNYLSAAPNAKWDALGEVVREAHQRGMKVEIWYSFTYYKSPQSPEFNPKHGGDPAWAARSLTAFQGKTNPMTDLCPTHPEARQWELKQIESLLNRYANVSGIHIEEPGFGYPQSCVCELCRSLFKSIHGQDLEKNIDTARAEDFRCIGTTEFIRELRERMNQRNPKPILSVNGGPFWRNDRSLGRDWKHWAELGWLDYYAAQNYSCDLASFTSYTQTILGDMPAACPIFVGIGVKWSGGETALPVILQQIDYGRSRGAKGILFFSAKALTDEYLNALKVGPFKMPAIYPLK